MSINVMSRVWAKSKQKGSGLLLILALADNADDKGVCWPGLDYLHKKIRMSERQTRRLLDTLEATGEVFVQRGGNGRGDKTCYLIASGMGQDEIATALVDHLHMDKATAAEKMDKMSPKKKADKMSPKTDKMSEKVDITVSGKGGHDHAQNGDNRHRTNTEPSDEPPDAGARDSSADLELQLILFAILRVTGLDYRLVPAVVEQARAYQAAGYTAEQVAATWYVWRDSNQWKLKTDPGRRPKLDEVTQCLGQMLGGNEFKYTPEMETESIIRRVRASGDFAALQPGYSPVLESGTMEDYS